MNDTPNEQPSAAPMNCAFALLEPADLEFLGEVLGVRGSARGGTPGSGDAARGANGSGDAARGADGSAAAGEEGAGTRTSARRRAELLHELRYAGSSDIMYAARRAMGSEPGVSFEEVVRDVARTLGVSDPPARPEAAGGAAIGSGPTGSTSTGSPPKDASRALVEHVATEHAAATFGKLPREEQQKMLEDLGVEREKAAAFLARSAGVFALPALIQAFNHFVVQGLIKTVLFGSIAKFIGARLAGQLFTFLAGRMPWWVGWIGPAAWTASIGWTAIDLQGPAYRKTVPAVLYLGLCSLRERAAAPGAP